MFHDLGLTGSTATDQRFEIDGADEARRFLARHGIAETAPARLDGDRPAHHPGDPAHMAPEIALVTRGVELDVLGIGYDAIPTTSARPSSRRTRAPTSSGQILAAFTEGLKRRPQTTFGNVKADVLAHFVPASAARTSSRSSRTPPGPSS